MNCNFYQEIFNLYLNHTIASPLTQYETELYFLYLCGFLLKHSKSIHCLMAVCGRGPGRFCQAHPRSLGAIRQALRAR